MVKRKARSSGSGRTPSKRQAQSSGSGSGRSPLPPGAVNLHKIDPDGDVLLKFSRHASSSDVESEAGEAVELFINVHMRVSSKHLIMVSPVFKAMLQRDNFREGQQLGNTGSVEIPLPDDDSDAFLIILDIVHGRHRQVPRTTSLEMLTQISILVDKYQMVEAVEVFSDGWIEHLKHPDPESYIQGLPDAYESLEQQRTVHRWIGISWVFGRPVEFKEMTALMGRGCYADLESMEEVPIPGLVLEIIVKQRETAISGVFKYLEQTLKKYQSAAQICPKSHSTNHGAACDSMVLGSILRGAAMRGIYPIPMSPYDDMTFNHLSISLFDLEILSYCKLQNASTHSNYGDMHGVKDSIIKTVEKWDSFLCGLELEDLKSLPAFGGRGPQLRQRRR